MQFTYHRLQPKSLPATATLRTSGSIGLYGQSDGVACTRARSEPGFEYRLSGYKTCALSLDEK